MRRTSLLLIALVLVASGALCAQSAPGDGLAAFQRKVEQYAEMHRRLEGPLPPLQAATDMAEVYRLMDALRGRIRAERTGQGQGYLLTPAMIALVRARLMSCLTIDDIAETEAEIEEHSPPNMPAPRVNQRLPEDAPFGLVAPQALRALPPLPPELRYVVLAKALVIWDHHADLVVDIAPGVFDAASYRSAGKLAR